MSVFKHESRQNSGQIADPQALEWVTGQASDVDSLLDEIDSVLEVNAEDFVKSFVQKGGQ